MANEIINGVDLGKLPQPILAEHSEWVDLYYFAWRQAAQHIREIRGRRYMDAAWDPDRNFQWVWDTCFMALYCRYGGGQYPGGPSLDNFYDLQRSDGYISMTYDMTAGQEPWPDRINPPLFAWAEWEYYRTTGDASRLARVVPPIEKLMAWIDAHRRTAPHRRLRAEDNAIDGRGDSADSYQLYYFRDCGSSGMDDSPRTPRMADAGQFYDWIDLSSQMALSFRMLSRMHAVLGHREATEYWHNRAEELGALINTELWCPRTRFYHDRTLPSNFVGHKTVAAFWPILAEICPSTRLDALIEHLQDPEEFNRRIPVPSLAADDANYCPWGTYWVGGVWAPTNYMITRGLMRAGREDVAHAIAMGYLGGLARTYKFVTPHTLWECYSAEEDLPGLAAYTRERVKPNFVGWSGLGPIAMLIENVLGLDLDAPARILHWTLHLTEEHGICQLAVPGGHLDLLCGFRGSADDPAQLEIRSDVPLTLQIDRGEMTATVETQPGRLVRVTV